MGWVLIIVGILLLGVVLYVLMYSYRKDPATVQERVQSLNDNKFSTDMTRFAARGELKSSVARSELANQLTGEMSAIIGMNEGLKQAENSEFDRLNNLERLNTNLEIERANYQTLLAQNTLTQKLIGLASDKDMDLNTYSEWKKKLELDRLDLDKQWQDAENQLKAGFIFQLQAHQHLALMTEYIGKLYDRAEELKGRGKDREHRLIEEHIEFMEGDFRGRQRLLQATQQENIQGSDENSDISGNDRQTVQDAEE